MKVQGRGVHPGQLIRLDKAIKFYTSEKMRNFRGNVWTDRLSKMKVIASSLDNQKDSQSSNNSKSCFIYQINCLLHGQKIIDEFDSSKSSIPNPINPKDPLYGFRDYYIFITVRSETDGVLFTLKTSNQRITRIDSPFKQTVSIDISGFPRSVDKEFVPYTGDDLLPGNQDMHKNTKLISDITVFNTNKQIFLYRSGYLWLQPSKYNSSTYYASNLASSQESQLNLNFRVEKGKTMIASCSLTIGLNIIAHRYGKRSIKLVQVSQSIIDMSQHEDPLNLFHSSSLSSSQQNNPIDIN